MSIESKKIVTDSELSENLAEQGTRRKPCRPAIQGGPAQPSPAKAAKDPKDPKPLTEGQKTNLRKYKEAWEAMLDDYNKMVADTNWEAEPYKSYTNKLLLKAASRAAEHATDQCHLLDSIMDGAVLLSSEQFYGSAGEVKEKWKAVKDDVSKNSDKIWNLNRSLQDLQSTYDDEQAELEKKAQAQLQKEEEEAAILEAHKKSQWPARTLAPELDLFGNSSAAQPHCGAGAEEDTLLESSARVLEVAPAVI